MPKGGRAVRPWRLPNKRQNTFFMADELTLAKIREAANALAGMSVKSSSPTFIGPVIILHPTFEAVVQQWSEFGQKWICPEFRCDPTYNLDICLDCGDEKSVHEGGYWTTP